MMIKKFISYIMIASVFAIAIVSTSCSNDDDEPQPEEKTAEEIKAENMAEFATIIGNGVTNKKHRFAVALEPIDKITKEVFDKLTFYDNEDDHIRHYFKFDGEKYFYEDGGMTMQGNAFTFEKADNIFTLYASIQDEKGVHFDDTPSDDDSMLKVTYDTQTDIITIYSGGYVGGVYSGTGIQQYKAEPYSPSNETTGRTIKTNFAKIGSTSFTGVHAVHVELEGQNFSARIAAGLLKPYGNHHVKFTSLANGKTRVQFCDAGGNVSGNSVPTDYYYSTTKHFWKNRMPMALNLDDVNFTYNSTTGSISPGTNVMARARPNSNPNGITPPFFGGTMVNQNSGSNATIISSSGNTASNFRVEIKLDFQINFHCVITK